MKKQIKLPKRFGTMKNIKKDPKSITCWAVVYKKDTPSITRVIKKGDICYISTQKSIAGYACNGYTKLVEGTFTFKK